MDSSEKYLEELFDEALKTGEKTAKDFKEEDVHDWRVAIKKLKAAFLFLQYFDKKLDEDILKKVKKIFSRAGKIRELQLLQGFLKKIRARRFQKSKMKFLHDLQEDEQKREKKFETKYRDHGEETLKYFKEELARSEKKIVAGKITGYFKEKIEEILRLMRKENLSAEEYHRIRKLLKELKYNLSFADEESKKLVLKNFSEDEIEKLEEALGDWHDQTIIIARLNEILMNRKGTFLQKAFADHAFTNSKRKASVMLKKIQEEFRGKAEYRAAAS